METRSILLVEDDPDDRARVKRMLQGHRREFRLVECATGAEAIQHIRRDGASFDCVLLDHFLPDMDAEQVLRQVRQASGRMPVAVSVLTGHDDDEAAARVIELGAEDYLLKDEVTMHGLVRSIENVVERFEIRRQLDAQRAAVDLRNERLESMRIELETHLEELSAANQARDRFVAMMSHEMRTPLNAILGYAELLELEIDGPINEGQRRNLDRIRVGSRHLLDLINDVLDIARADARKLELDVRPVDAHAVIEEIVALLENQAAQKGDTLEATVAEGLPLVSADLQRLRQILTNLVGNAIKFTNGGRITVAATTSPDRSRVAIAVADSGIGIEPANIEKVFEEFYQADNALTRLYGGSGLGLAISQRLALAMDGEITVTSTHGAGSVFTLTLPAARSGSEVRPQDTAQRDARMHQLEQQSAAARRQPVSVVAFGDDADALAALTLQVSPAVRLAWTISASEVPELTAREQASLVILDVGSRDGTAWRIAHAISEMEMSVPPAILLLPEIIAVRSDGADAAAVDLGWIALVPKPFTSDQLARAVATAAGRHHESPPGEGQADDYEVLLIDDDEDSRRIASRVLRERGVRVRECVDGENGLVEMRRRPPDVAVLDLMMPVLDGFGVLAAMRSDPLLASIPVVVLTAKTLTDAERQFLTRTAVRVLQKGEHRLADIAALVLRAARSTHGG
jgi:signal transduction histidine kinase